jgi:hypothetical protein
MKAHQGSLTARAQKRGTPKVVTKLISQNKILSEIIRGSGRCPKNPNQTLLAPELKDQVDENSSTILRGIARKFKQHILDNEMLLK